MEPKTDPCGTPCLKSPDHVSIWTFHINSRWRPSWFYLFIYFIPKHICPLQIPDKTNDMQTYRETGCEVSLFSCHFCLIECKAKKTIFSSQDCCILVIFSVSCLVFRSSFYIIIICVLLVTVVEMWCFALLCSTCIQCTLTLHKFCDVCWKCVQLFYFGLSIS